MSSWANRQQIHRRNLSQIPEALRPPPPVPRAERPEVLLSESYQPIYSEEDNTLSLGAAEQNSIEYPWAFGSNVHDVRGKKGGASVSAELAALVSALPSSQPGIVPPHPDAKELSARGKSYVFVLLRHLRNPSDNELWIASYNSIRRYYTNKIIIIDDNSQLNTVNGKLSQTEVIYSDYAGAGETLPYYYFLMHRWADRMIFLHDTMFLYRPFRPEEVETDARFHWSFHVDKTDGEKRVRPFLPSLRNHKELVPLLDTPDAWRACFGVAMVVSLPVVEALEEKYKLFSTMVMMIRNRKDREMAERLVGLVFFHEGYVTLDTCDTFGDIMKYPHAFDSGKTNLGRARYDIEQAGYDSALIKVWRGR